MARTSAIPQVRPVIEAREILKARGVINDIYIDDKVKDYIVDLVCATREPQEYKIDVKDFILMGASPRATIALTLAAKAYAFLKGRGYVTPQDVKSIGMDVLRHRIMITYEAEAEEKTSETIIQKIKRYEAELGVTLIIVALDNPGLEPDAVLRAIRTFGEKIIPYI